MQTNWYVITGAPCSGKTTVVNLLKEKGYRTTIENARHYIDTIREDGGSIEQIREDQREFQRRILRSQIQVETALSPHETVFLDRAIPDAVAYYRFLGFEIDSVLSSAMRTVSYKKIFILDYLPLVQDYARKEDQVAQKKLHELISRVYHELPFTVIHVPILTTEQRVDLILKNLL